MLSKDATKAEQVDAINRLTRKVNMLVGVLQANRIRVPLSEEDD